MHGHTLQEAVAGEFSFNAERGLLQICKKHYITIKYCLKIEFISNSVEFAENRHAYFEHRLYRAMNGLGTKE